MSRIAFAHRTRCTYNTKSNRTKLVKTPGGRLVRHKIVKVSKAPKCPISGVRLHGFMRKPTHVAARKGHYRCRVSRPYGGQYSPQVVREKILKAFFQNEKACVQAVMQEKARAAKAAAGKKH